MKILVLSDSHSGLRFMRQCIDAVKPNAVIHLGDYYDDGQAMAQEYPHLYFYGVPGNCDRYFNIMGAPEKLCMQVCGIRLYMTHGHLHGVKSGLSRLIDDAKEKQVQVVLFGHTHCPFCDRTEDGLWILNPGTCACDSGTAGLMIVENGKISDCRVLQQSDLEKY